MTGRNDMRDVWREFNDNRKGRNLFDPFGDHACVFRNLAHRGAHSAFAHTVGAAEIKLETITACILRTLCDLLPSLFLGLDHQRDNDRVFRIFFLALRNFFEVDLERPVGDQLYVIQPDHPQSALIKTRKPRRHIRDRLAKRFPNCSAPTCVERAFYHRAHIRRRRARQPERIRRFDPCEIDT